MGTTNKAVTAAVANPIKQERKRQLENLLEAEAQKISSKKVWNIFFSINEYEAFIKWFQKKADFIHAE